MATYHPEHRTRWLLIAIVLLAIAAVIWFWKFAD
jgi:hypothetical protein